MKIHISPSIENGLWIFDRPPIKESWRRYMNNQRLNVGPKELPTTNRSKPQTTKGPTGIFSVLWVWGISFFVSSLGKLPRRDRSWPLELLTNRICMPIEKRPFSRFYRQFIRGIFFASTILFLWTLQIWCWCWRFPRNRQVLIVNRQRLIPDLSLGLACRRLEIWHSSRAIRRKVS